MELKDPVLVSAVGEDSGEGVVVVVVDSVVVLVVASGDALAAVAGVSVFCSQAASKAAPARMQINCFIIINKISPTLLRSKKRLLAVRFTMALRILSCAPRLPRDRSAYRRGC